MYNFSPIQGTRTKMMKTQRTNPSPTFNQDQDLVPWIGGQLYIEILNMYFSNIRDISGYVGKLPEQHFNVWMCSNPMNNIFLGEIQMKSGSWSGTNITDPVKPELTAGPNGGYC